MTSQNTPQLGIEDTDVKSITSGLAGVLADTFTLYVKTHGYHWNVTGPHFRSLHELFEEQYTELFEAIDVLAERLRALGDVAPGSLAEFNELASLKDRESTDEASVMVANLLSDHETLVRSIRPVVEVAEEAGDGATADLLNARLAAHEQTAWMLRSVTG